MSVARAQIDDEHEAVYQRYLTSTEGSRSPSVRQFLYGHEPDRGLFDTWEVALREGGRLAAEVMEQGASLHGRFHRKNPSANGRLATPSTVDSVTSPAT